ncbi:MAG: glycosyltransferase [Bacteroidota bacterium]
MANEQNNIKILFLSAWYPSRIDPMLGLFVERHARALATKCKVAVLYVQPVSQAKQKFESEIRNEGNITEVIIYYRNINFPLIGTFLKAFRYHKSFKKGFRIIREEFGNFDLIHVNILTRTGVIAYLKKKSSGIPYIITEHWSRYLPLTNTYKGAFRKFMTKKVVKNASAFTAVTGNLKKAMIVHGLDHHDFRIIPNVVDTDFFKPAGYKAERSKKEFIHVSCFEDRSKNISGILRAVRQLSINRQDFLFRLIGDGIDSGQLKNYARLLGIPEDSVTFEGMKTGDELAAYFRNADFLIMFSNYENMPVVINEAFASGIPVISTDVGGISEFVNKDNGILVKSGDEKALADALNFMLDHINDFDPDELRRHAVEYFSVNAVAEKFLDIYKKVLKK